MEDFKPGDVVQLKSGGPKMTIQSVSPAYVTCQWFAGSKLEHGNLPKESLVIIKEQKKADK